MSGLALISKKEECKIYQFPMQEKPIKNHGTSTKTDALHTEEEIIAVTNYFKNEIIKCHSLKRETTARRNFTMFICAINLGLRGGDFCKLTWDVFFDENWEWRDSMDFTPEKTRHVGGTGKKVTLRWNEVFKHALTDWLNWQMLSGKINLTDYIFTTPHGHIDIDTWLQIMNKATKAAGINRRIGTHGLRKTMGNKYYKTAKDKTDALVQLKEYFRHSDQHTTMTYICLEEENMQETIDNMNHSTFFDENGNWKW